MPISDATRAQADLLRRQRRERARLESRYDFWGGPCECGLPLGECTIHERARPSQRPPDHDGWDVLLAEAGRGWGKTRLGAEYVRLMVEKGRWGQIALINETVKDVRDVQIEGESGLLAISPPWFRPIYEPSKARVTWPNGAIATIYSAEQPGLLRGPQFHGGWCVAAGTPILTEFGEVPIERVRPDDRVWTREGLRTVSSAGLTRRQTPVLRLKSADGHALDLTGAHLVFTVNKSWICCKDVLPGDIILAWKYRSVLRPGSSGRTSAGIATERATTRIEPGRSCTRPSGRGSTTARFPMVTSSITRTRTRATTTCRTSNSCRSRSTRECTARPGPPIILGLSSRAASKCVSGLRSFGRTASREMLPVSAAGRSTSLSGCGRSSAIAPVPRVTTVASVEPNGLADVYDLKVEGCPEFIAGSILVHNCDELSKWRHAQAETWDMLQFGLRLGEHPQVVVTNTPLPSKKYKEIRSHPRTYRIGGSTFENRAHLAPSFFDRVTGQYQGTRLGRQELEAELFEDTPGALWSTALLESTRCKDAIPRGVDIVRTVIGVDPAGRIQDMTRLVLGVSAKTREPGKGDEAGIVVACLGDDGHAYVLADCSTLGSPHAWGAAVADAYLRYAADRVVGEANHGGVTVEEVIRTVAKHRGVPNIAYKPVWASKGKHTRAEPVAALYEQNRVHHIGCHSELEAEMCDWLPGGSSPNRMDALVFTLTELMLQGGSGGSVEVGVPRERDAPLFAS